MSPAVTKAYQPPTGSQTTTLEDILRASRRGVPSRSRQGVLFSAPRSDQTLHYAGDPGVLDRPCVAIVGTRDVSDAGAARARRLARELASAGITVVSGLARGVDTHALQSAIDTGGRTVGVIATPLDQVTPRTNARLQETIYRDHLLISQFAIGVAVRKTNFPMRNRVMAAISDATVIVEASDTSGTLHQAVECTRLGRSLFIMRACAMDSNLRWPKDFLKYETTTVLTRTEDIIERFAD